MPDYRVPLRDIRFAMDEVLSFPSHYAARPHCEDASPDMVNVIIEEAAKFAENEVVPLHHIGDQQGCQWQGSAVTTPDGFKAADQAFVENGWPGLAQLTEYCGQGMPPSMNSLLIEILSTANHAWCMYPTLTWGEVGTGGIGR